MSADNIYTNTQTNKQTNLKYPAKLKLKYW